MKTTTKKINNLKPDPNQPRKIFNQEALNSLAQTYKVEGVINPIEIDENNMIITGERRWRAANLAGLKEVPCIIKENLKPYDRFRRQITENENREDMNAWEKATAYKRLLKMKGYKCPSDGQFNKGRIGNGIRELARELGKSKSHVAEMLMLLREPDDIQKALKKGTVKPTAIHVANTVKDKVLQNKLKKKIVSGEIRTKDGARFIASGIDRSDKETGKRLLNKDYTGKDAYQVAEEVAAEAPALHHKIHEHDNAVSRLNTAINTIKKHLDEDKVPNKVRPKLMSLMVELNKRYKDKLINV